MAKLPSTTTPAAGSARSIAWAARRRSFVYRHLHYFDMAHRSSSSPTSTWRCARARRDREEVGRAALYRRARPAGARRPSRSARQRCPGQSPVEELAPAAAGAGAAAVRGGRSSAQRRPGSSAARSRPGAPRADRRPARNGRWRTTSRRRALDFADLAQARQGRARSSRTSPRLRQPRAARGLQVRPPVPSSSSRSARQLPRGGPASWAAAFAASRAAGLLAGARRALRCCRTSAIRRRAGAALLAAASGVEFARPCAVLRARRLRASDDRASKEARRAMPNLKRRHACLVRRSRWAWSAASIVGDLRPPERRPPPRAGEPRTGRGGFVRSSAAGRRGAVAARAVRVAGSP